MDGRRTGLGWQEDWPWMAGGLALDGRRTGLGWQEEVRSLEDAQCGGRQGRRIESVFPAEAAPHDQLRTPVGTRSFTEVGAERGREDDVRCGGGEEDRRE